MIRGVISSLALGGCSSVFGLEPPVRLDAATADTIHDTTSPGDTASNCTDVTFDEDSDGLPDSCDACPTIASNGADSDTDGLPDACDVNLAQSGDRILFASMFTAQTDLAAFEADSTTWMASDHGTLRVTGGDPMRLLQTYDATHIELRVAGWQAVTSTGKLDVRTSSTTCQLEEGPCGGGTGTAICVRLTPSQISSAELGAAPSQLTLITMTRQLTDTSCTVSASATAASARSTAPLGTTFEVRPDTGSDLIVRSLVIYGAK